MNSLLKSLAALAAIYLCVVVAMALLQRRLQYFPDTSPALPDRAGFAGAEVVTLTTSDGERLRAWWKSPRDEHAPVFLYLHGNAANLEARGERFAHMASEGAGIFALTWRGYGGSTGAPSEAGLHLDATAAYAWLQARIAPRRLVVFGESLGSAMAIRIAADRQVAALVLDSPYSAAVDVAASVYWWLPVRLLMLDTLRAIDDAPMVRVPILAVHCRSDPVIPLAIAERLMSAFPARPRLQILESACHVPSLDAWPVDIRRFAADAVAPR
jgi:hypothetical protein